MGDTGAGMIGAMLGLFLVLVTEAAFFSVLDPILAEATAPFGPMGVLMRAVIWGGPPVTLSAAIVLDSR